MPFRRSKTFLNAATRSPITHRLGALVHGVPIRMSIGPGMPVLDVPVTKSARAVAHTRLEVNAPPGHVLLVSRCAVNQHGLEIAGSFFAVRIFKCKCRPPISRAGVRGSGDECRWTRTRSRLKSACSRATPKSHPRLPLHCRLCTLCSFLCGGLHGVLFGPVAQRKMERV